MEPHNFPNELLSHQHLVGGDCVSSENRCHVGVIVSFVIFQSEVVIIVVIGRNLGMLCVSFQAEWYLGPGLYWSSLQTRARKMESVAWSHETIVCSLLPKCSRCFVGWLCLEVEQSKRRMAGVDWSKHCFASYATCFPWV